MNQSSVNLGINLTNTGFNLTNNLTSGFLGVSGGVTFIGGNPATIILPTESTELAGVSISNSFKTLQYFPAGLCASSVLVGGVNVGISGSGGITFISGDSNSYEFPDSSTKLAGVSVSNTFTALQTFTAGISASGATFAGAISAPNLVSLSGSNTFTGLQNFGGGVSAAGGITFNTDISVNLLTFGVGSNGTVGDLAVGYNTLISNTTGYSNTAVGGAVLSNNTSGNHNTGIGNAALLNNTTGIYNVAVGSGALGENKSASSNTAVGYYALSAATASNSGFNTAIGDSSMILFQRGTSNVAMGNSSLSALLRGSRNVSIGSSSSSITTAITGGVYIGANTSSLGNTYDFEIVIGADAIGLGPNTTVIGKTTQTAAHIYGRVNAPGGISASGATLTTINLTGSTIRTNQTEVNMFTDTNTIINIGGVGLTLNLGSTYGNSTTTVPSKLFVSKTHVFTGTGANIIYPNSQFHETFDIAMKYFPSGWSGTVDLFTIDKREYSNIDLFIQSERGPSGPPVLNTTTAAQVDKISAMYIGNSGEVPPGGSEITTFNYNNYYKFAVGPGIWGFGGEGATFIEYGITWENDGNEYTVNATIPSDKAFDGEEQIYIKTLITGIRKIFTQSRGTGGGAAGGGNSIDCCVPGSPCFDICLNPNP